MNAPAPLAITTYDGSGQSVHPDVIFVPGGLAGYSYWLAFTPYPNTRDRFENPSLRASNDGYHWILPDGVPDPVIPVPAHPREHHADPALVFHDGRLYMYYMTTNESERRTRFSVVHSADGRAWSSAQVVCEDPFCVSPSVLRRGGEWLMWYVDYDTDQRAPKSDVLLRIGSQPEVFGEAVTCAISVPGHIIWHIDVIQVDDGFEALLAAFPQTSTLSNCRLFHAVSPDGRRFTLSEPSPLLTPSGTRWDGRIIYRSSFLKDEDGRYRIWYSAASWASTWGIGYLEGPLGDLRPTDRAPTMARTGSMLTDAAGFMRYLGGRILPRSMVARIRRAMSR